jgi:hypothetical protein
MRGIRKKFAVIYPSYNNYVLLEKVVIPRMKRFQEDVILVVVDDKSTAVQHQLGKEVCRLHDIIFLENARKGVASAVDTAISFLVREEVCDLEWIFVSQQDIFPSELSFFEDFRTNINLATAIGRVGAVGFNALDKFYSADSVQEGLLGSFFLAKKPKIGDRLAFVFSVANLKNLIRNPLSVMNSWKGFMGQRRFFSPRTFRDFSKIRQTSSDIFSIELPMWAFIAINMRIWRENIETSTGFVFHLWFNDIAMQLLSRNYHCLVFSRMHVNNDQSIKEAFGFIGNSADAGRLKLTQQVEAYGNHLQLFEMRWGFDYESPWRFSRYIKKRYAGTLVATHFSHNLDLGPLEFKDQ